MIYNEKYWLSSLRIKSTGSDMFWMSYQRYSKNGNLIICDRYI